MTQDITGASPGPAKPPWQKVLWRKQPYEDDYVPKSFLAELDDIRELQGPPVQASLNVCSQLSDPRLLSLGWSLEHCRSHSTWQ